MLKNTFLFSLFLIGSLIGKADTVNSINIYETIAIDLIEKYQINKITQKKDGYYVMEYKGKELTKGTYKNGQRNGGWVFMGINDTIQQKGMYVDGKKEGMWISYYSDGKIACYMPFKNGVKDGVVKSLYENGNVSSETKYINNRLEGISTHYYSDGKLSHTETYVNDTLNGLAKEYYENGILKEEKYFKKGKRDSTYLFYYDSGVLWEHIIYKNGNEYNVLAYNSPDGKPINCCTLKDGNGIMRFYDESSKMTKEISYKNSMKDGPYKLVENGIVRDDGNYKENVYHGEWIEYYETGELYLKINYTEGKKNGKATYFFKDGTISQQGEFINDEQEGVWKSFDKNNNLKSETTFSKGKYHGEAKFYANGIVVNSGEYANGSKIGNWKFFDNKGRFSSKIDFGSVVEDKKESYSDNSAEIEKQESEIFTITRQMPEFPGGQSMMVKFISENIVFPKSAKKKGIAGTVYVNFILSNTGEIEKATILRGVYSDLDNEALRIVTIMPRWSPGMQDGKPVSVSFNLPIKYTLK